MKTLSNAKAIGLTASVAAVALTLSLSLGPSGFRLPSGGAYAGLIMTEIRLPRALLGALIGAALGLSGAVLQGFLRNPLAEPGLIGVSSGASLGAVIAIHGSFAGSLMIALPVFGLAGAVVSMIAVMALAGHRGGALTFILAGVAISTMASALTSLVMNLSSNPFAQNEMMYWLMGSINDRSMVHVWIAAPLIIAGLSILLSVRKSLDALTLGDDAAHNLGFDVGRVRLVVIFGVALAVGAATSVAGSIAFVGLIVPHLLRPYLDPMPSRLLLPSLFGGAALVLTADVLLRILSPVGDLKLGVVTSIIGAPLFLHLILKARRDIAV